MLVAVSLTLAYTRAFLLLAYMFILSVYEGRVRVCVLFSFMRWKLLFIDTNCDISKDGQLALQYIHIHRIL